MSQSTPDKTKGDESSPAKSAKSGSSSRFAQQLSVLTERYLACTFADFGTLALLVLQAPLIGWFCTLVWGSVEAETPSLRFVLVLAAIWFGCINACREVVKERAILERERIFGLSPAAYVASKYVVLAGLSFVQVLLMQVMVEREVGLTGNALVHLMALWLSAMCGVGLGLCVSAFAKRQERAVGAIPILLLPQILFSEFSIPEDKFSDVVNVVEALMPAGWGYEVFKMTADANSDFLDVLGPFCALVLYASLLGLLANLIVRFKRAT